MICGIGCDLLNMNNIPDASLAAGDPFYEKVFTEAEKMQASESASCGDYLRRRFCAKEAVFKALGENPDKARINEIEILDDAFGAPHVLLHGKLKENARSRGIVQLHISLSSDSGYAQAFAVAESFGQEILDQQERNEQVL